MHTHTKKIIYFFNAIALQIIIYEQTTLPDCTISIPLLEQYYKTKYASENIIECKQKCSYFL